MNELTIYTYARCSTCRAAVKWLQQHAVAFTEKPIKESPPGLTELSAMLAGQPGGLRRLFNTSGLEYRALGLAARLPAMPVDDALRLLAGNGMLIKRPFLLGPGVALVGFNEKAWAAALARR
ncbi:MAG: arsenate reductase family protein [Opitutae bacterium]